MRFIIRKSPIQLGADPHSIFLWQGVHEAGFITFTCVLLRMYMYRTSALLSNSWALVWSKKSTSICPSYNIDS